MKKFIFLALLTLGLVVSSPQKAEAQNSNVVEYYQNSLNQILEKVKIGGGKYRANGITYKVYIYDDDDILIVDIYYKDSNGDNIKIEIFINKY